MESEERVLGRTAYEAYCVATGGKSAITGDTLPEFGATPELVQTAWIAAAQAIKELTISAFL